MEPLPIDPLVPQLAALLAREPAVVLEAPPGAGKTTQVPRGLLDAGMLEVGEAAAGGAARGPRVADELGESLGGTVGYQVRFEDVSSARTKIRFVTEGIPTRRLHSDPKLSGVSVGLLDEFHERHLQGDPGLPPIQFNPVTISNSFGVLKFDTFPTNPAHFQLTVNSTTPPLLLKTDPAYMRATLTLQASALHFDPGLPDGVVPASTLTVPITAGSLSIVPLQLLISSDPANPVPDCDLNGDGVVNTTDATATNPDGVSVGVVYTAVSASIIRWKSGACGANGSVSCGGEQCSTAVGAGSSVACVSTQVVSDGNIDMGSPALRPLRDAPKDTQALRGRRCRPVLAPPSGRRPTPAAPAQAGDPPRARTTSVPQQVTSATTGRT